MGDRPYVDFQEVKEKCPIPDVLDKLGLLDQFTRKGDTLTGVCPLPSHVHGPKPNPEQFKINNWIAILHRDVHSHLGQFPGKLDLVKGVPVGLDVRLEAEIDDADAYCLMQSWGNGIEIASSVVFNWKRHLIPRVGVCVLIRRAS